jgi:hypothetical protein
MAGFVKLDAGILTSTLWASRDQTDIFITSLLMAEPYELTSELPQIDVESLEETGWQVPPGWYGFVPAAGSAIIGRSHVDPVVGFKVLRALGSPDPESRTSAHDGRRLVRVDGGYIVLNYMKFRDRDYTAADRMRRLRERRKGEAVTRNVTPVTRNVTHAESREQRAEAYPEEQSDSRGLAKPRGLAKARECSVQRPDDVSQQTWDDFLAHRRTKKGTVTATVIKQHRAEAAKAGITLEEALAIAVSSNWQGFRAEYYTSSRGRSGGHTPIVPKDLPLSYYADTGPVNKNGWLIKPVEGVNP